MMSMRSPLSRVRGLGSAHSGTEHFLAQRMTAIANVPLMIFFIYLLVTLAGRSHATVAATLNNSTTAIFLLAAIVSVMMHMRIGMQVIIEDYVHHDGLKMTLMVANTFFSIAVGLTAAFAVLKLNFGL
jgi:succinate dehydrogenase / fumarate reductase, membrane anchor subunit